MKNKSFLLLTGLLSGIILASCSSSPSIKDKIEVYKDNSIAKIDDLLVKVDHIDASQDYSSVLKGYKSKIYLSFTNGGNTEQKINLRDSYITYEADGSTFKSKVKVDKDTIGGNEKVFVSYMAATTTPLSENKYCLKTTINDVKYLLHLYDKPDNERKDFTVTYKIGDQIVNTVTIKENRIIGEDYIYENPNHLSHCSVWKTSDGEPIGSSTIVNSDLTLIGKEKDNILFADIDDSSTSVSSLEYIPSDRVVVVPKLHNGKNVTEIGESFFFSQQVKTIYLPKTITTIKENNFYACTILKEINYEGTEAEYLAIDNMSKDNIPSTVQINYETIFNS